MSELATDGKPFDPMNEPRYRVKLDGSTVRAAWWECPYCGHPFRSRKSCAAHCKGRSGFMPTCPRLQRRTP